MQNFRPSLMNPMGPTNLERFLGLSTKKTHLVDISRVENTWKGLHGKLLQWKVSVFVGEV